ncbi:MAG: SpoIIE family protein phosphatase, partial [Oscillospiraceae bacterium]|nr:SpoIIE family protein phosphatase [Oscillospiraceae bacterium]
RGEDFPSYFVDRCVRFPTFLAAVNTELRAFLLRRQYRRELDAAHARSAGQYAQMSELLSQTAAASAAAQTGVAAPPLPYRIGVTMRPKDGESVSGDCVSTFETDAGELCLLLSDGMGSGEDARRESAMAVRLLERFLRAGVEAPPALRTLNSALNLRAEVSDSFTTIDLLTLSLKNGEGELYKYGAAPSYIKRGARVRRVSCTCLPAGLAEGALPPETTHVRLESGSFFVMVTDGVADSTNDAWLQRLLTDWEGENPQLLVSAILADSYEHKGADDDAGVLVLYLPKGEIETPAEV